MLGMGIPGYVSSFSKAYITNRTYRIYQEIGPGQRICLLKLAVEHFEKHQRPLRIAIDISIWNFQVQGGRGELHVHR